MVSVMSILRFWIEPMSWIQSQSNHPPPIISASLCLFGPVRDLLSPCPRDWGKVLVDYFLMVLVVGWPPPWCRFGWHHHREWTLEVTLVRE